MTINSVSSGRNAAAHVPTTQPAKKPAVNFSELMNAGMAAQPQAVTPASVADATLLTQTGKVA
ncbi:hypothetical protein Herbaro_14810 [Herbaspirillum sp. WKF16]|uniref:hypothetical protein n=1 Tax=Herbaspirillum sp. WKF16 TaxID=3028312 RepID=UPI0023A96250|nr:hypothetical protein [Herbaspirillum sp. WKF16]WDZ94755.1 hypothetical protein Herbaro_14810 [Herbaspirillum sp. WKF16]